MCNIICMFCEKLFFSLSELSNHARISHKALMNSQIKCNIGTCTRTYHKFQSLLKHIRSGLYVQILYKKIVLRKI